MFEDILGPAAPYVDRDLKPEIPDLDEDEIDETPVIKRRSQALTGSGSGKPWSTGRMPQKRPWRT